MSPEGAVQTREWHIVTCEFPPQVGGVADYAMSIATGLAEAGQDVHVWCPPATGPLADAQGVSIHREMGRFSWGDLRRVGRALDRQPYPRRLFVQWVPHGYGYRSVNVMFAAWLASRAWRHGDELHVMIHEPFLPFSFRPRQFAAALIHRAMLMAACSGAARVWLSTPAWARATRPYIRRAVPVAWLPLPAPIARDAARPDANRTRAGLETSAPPLVGHFGTHSPLVTALLGPALEVILGRSAARFVLIGYGSDRFRAEFLRTHPDMADRLQATGTLDANALGAHLHACDLMVQPYPDGVSARRTSTLAMMAHEIPVITNRGALTESFWTDEHGIALVNEPDGVQIGEAALALLADPTACRRRAVAARETYDRVFDVRHAVAALEGAC